MIGFKCSSVFFLYHKYIFPSFHSAKSYFVLYATWNRLCVLNLVICFLSIYAKVKIQ